MHPRACPISRGIAGFLPISWEIAGFLPISRGITGFLPSSQEIAGFRPSINCARIKMISLICSLYLGGPHPSNLSPEWGHVPYRLALMVFSPEGLAGALVARHREQ